MAKNKSQRQETSEVAIPYEKRLLSLYEGNDTLLKICSFVANNGSLIDLCREWDVQYGDVATWIHADEEREAAYTKALNLRGEWVCEAVLRELRLIGLSDVRELYDENGHLKDPGDWPEEIARSVAGVETKEIFDEEGVKEGEVKKVKLWDKLRAIELLGKNLSLFLERKELKVTMTLEDLLEKSMKDVTPK
jgi:hypothetical protein